MLLELDLATIAFQIVNFLAMTVLLYYFLLKPVARRVAERAAERERTAQEIALEKQRATEARVALEERLERAEDEADSIVNSAEERIEAARRALIEETYAEAESIRADAYREVQQMRLQALMQNQEEILDAVMEISGHAIRAAAPPGLHDAMVGRLGESIRELARTDIASIESLRRGLGTRTPIAEIRSAQPLTQEQQGELARIIARLADRQVGLEFVTDETLIAGVQVRLGDMVIDSTIAGDLEELREGTGQELTKRLSHE